MQESLLRELQNLRPTIKRRWEALLRTRPIASPLGNPDSLIYLMDWTFDQFFELMRKAHTRRRMPQRKGSARCEIDQTGCVCGKNPLLTYFQTAELAIIDSVLPLIEPSERENILMEVSRALRQVGAQEVETFCAVCQHRQSQGVHTHAHAGAGK